MSTNAHRLLVACECGPMASSVRGHFHYMEVTDFNTSSIRRIRKFYSETERPEYGTYDEANDEDVEDMHLSSDEREALSRLVAEHYVEASERQLKANAELQEKIRILRADLARQESYCQKAHWSKR